jgi:hypothetical protein
MDAACFAAVRFSPNGTTGCSHGRESVVGVDIVTSSPEGTAGQFENQDSCRPSRTAPDVYAPSHGLTSTWLVLFRCSGLRRQGGWK